MSWHTDNRPVVTGLGVVAPNGIGLDAFWESLLAGRSSVAPITLFNAEHFSTRIAAEVKGFDPRLHLLPDVKWKRMARHTQFALSALDMALTDAGLANGSISPEQHVAMAIGVSTSAIEIVETATTGMLHDKSNRLSPWLLWASQPNAVSATLAQQLGSRVSWMTVSTACQAGADAILVAADAIRSGRAEIAITGGADAPITLSTCASFVASRMLSVRNDDPARASRPFDRDRDGGVLAEGAGILVLESLAHARARGARIWLEICGGATCQDPLGSETATGMHGAMSLALANASVRTDELDYLCAHGPSDMTIDRVETDMVRRLFHHHAYRMPVSSIKGVTGNPLAAAGPFELIACALAMRHGMIPPTANLFIPDPACDLDYVPLHARRSRVRCAMLNVHGMGGGNTSIVLRHAPS